MAHIQIPRKEVEKHFKITDEIIEKINLFGTPVTLTDETFDIEVYPNRPDLLSAQGFFRAIKAFLGKEIGLKKYKINKPEKNYKVIIDKSLGNIRPYTACVIVKNLKFDDIKIKEIIDVQEKLHATLGRNRKRAAIGIYPLEKIALPIRFEARRPQEIKFIPLESSEEMNGLQILQRHPVGRDYASLLEGLEKFPVFIDAKGKVLSMPPIINSHETGKITEKTTEIFIECSGFDFKVLKKILNILAATFSDMGGKVYAMELRYAKKEITPDFSAEKMNISLENANKLLGLNLKEKDLEKLLPKMGYDYKKGSVFVPSWRTDVMHEVDIIEDLAIAYGYDKIIPEIPKVATIGEESAESKIERKISEILIGLGLLEASSYHLIKEEEAKIMKIEKIEVENSKTEYKILRPNLLIPALRTFSENKDNEYPQRIFEIGTIFEKDKKHISETGIRETEKLIIASSPGNFTELKQILDYLMKMLNLKYELKESKKEWLIEGRTGAVYIEGKECGYIGEVHPETLRDWGIKIPVAALEISLREVFKNFENC
jgi:phenylalanyl-tRNA synthetase beta chain